MTPRRPGASHKFAAVDDDTLAGEALAEHKRAVADDRLFREALSRALRAHKESLQACIGLQIKERA
jgi:hypothetical protein